MCISNYFHEYKEWHGKSIEQKEIVIFVVLRNKSQIYKTEWSSNGNDVAYIEQ